MSRWLLTSVELGMQMEPGCQIAQILAERWGAATGDKVAVHVHGAFPLPMGMEREDRCE